MQKIVIPQAGGYGQLCLEQHPDPKPAPGEVLVRTQFVGVNYADCVVRMGLYSSAKEYVGWPITPGFEFSGHVAALGEGVSGFRVDQPVFGVTRFGGYATHVSVPAYQLFTLPSALTLEQAAAFPTTALSAHYGLYRLANVRQGELVLIHSAAGGVGSALVQLAHARGAEVIGVVGRTHKVKMVEALGVSRIIDKSQEELWTRLEAFAANGVDVALDANGVSTLKGSYDHLGPGGRLVVYGFHSMMPRQGGRPNWLKLGWDWLRTPRFNPLDLTTDNRSVLAFNLSYMFHRADMLEEMMSELLALVEAGQLAVPEVTRFPLSDVAKAHAAIESGQTIGKLVLTT